MVLVHDALEHPWVAHRGRVLVRAHVELLCLDSRVVGRDVASEVEGFFQVTSPCLLEVLGAEDFVSTVVRV